MRSINSQNWRRESGSTPVVGSEDQQIGIVDEAATEPKLLPHPARQFLRRTVGKRCEPGTVDKLGDSRVPFGMGLPEQAAEKLDVLADAEVRIKILAQSSGHIGNAGAG
jgi:hypothetical protein